MNKKKITQEEPEQFLRKHKLWLDNKDGGERANLRDADLDYSTLPLWCGKIERPHDA